MNCNTCAKQSDCELKCTKRAFGSCREWEGIYIRKAEQERDLAIWWEAYLQLLSSVARNGEKLNVIADYALADYRAKRKELLG